MVYYASQKSSSLPCYVMLWKMLCECKNESQKANGKWLMENEKWEWLMENDLWNKNGHKNQNG